jgi:hypothetical protein
MNLPFAFVGLLRVTTTAWAGDLAANLPRTCGRLAALPGGRYPRRRRAAVFAPRFRTTNMKVNRVKNWTKIEGALLGLIAP